MAIIFPLFLSSSSFFWFLLPLTFAASSDSDALLKLKKSFTNASALDSWVSGSTPCSDDGAWNGVTCGNGVVTGLRLEGMGLSGKLDVEALVDMKGLRSLSVMNNAFTGNIPEVNRLGSSKALFLSGNNFSGEIPSDFFAKMGSLKKVWLSDNNFTGKIPSSLTQLSNLIDLHLENNEFSGRIPDFADQNLQSLNLSNNKLQGEIPFGLSKFKANSFSGNPGLCGEQLGIDCTKAYETPPGEQTSTTSTEPTSPSIYEDNDLDDDTKKIITASVALGIMVIFAVIFLVIRWRKKNQRLDCSVDERQGSSDEVVEVQVEPDNTRDQQVLEAVVIYNNGKSGNSSGRRGSSHGKTASGGTAVPGLVMVNDEKGVFGLPDLMKAAAEVLGNGDLGSCYKTVMANGAAMVVKRMRGMNALGKDSFDAEVKKLGMIRHPNILTPLAYHYRKEEKLFVYEYLPKGSLLYQLHGDREASRAELDWPTRLKIVRGIAEGLNHLHTELANLDVPHGNLKSSNVLLGPDYNPFLSDYGFSQLVNNERVEALFAYKTPEALQHGTVCPKSDVYCLGIIILEMLTGKFPSQYLSNRQGGSDVVQIVTSSLSEGRQAQLLDPEITDQQNSLGSMEKLLIVGALCTQTSPEQRLDLKESIRMIEEVQVGGHSTLGPSAQTKTMQILPSLQDGFGDAPTPAPAPAPAQSGSTSTNSATLREDNV